MGAAAKSNARELRPVEDCIYHPRGQVIAATDRNYVTRANSDEAKAARARSFALSDALIAMNREGITELPDAPMRHFFADGCYFRELFMPKGMICVAMIHKHEHIVHVSYGDFYLVDGESKIRMTGAQTFISPPGAKRNFIVLEDTLINTVHRMRDPDIRDVEAVEDMFFCTTEEAFQDYLKTCTDEAMP